ncbi:hypothetical protein D3C77_659180 [compost metagenome]
MHIAEQQGFHFLTVAVQRRVRIDLDLHLTWQTLFGQLLEQQRALPLRRAVRHHVGELDDDRIGSLDQTGDGQGNSAGQGLDSELQHSFYLIIFIKIFGSV